MDLLTKLDNGAREVTITVDFGEAGSSTKMQNLRAALLTRGVPDPILDDVIASHAIANLKVYFRAIAKSGMRPTKDRPDPLDDVAIQARVDKAIPSIAEAREAASAEKKLDATKKVFDKLTPEEQETYIANLQAIFAAKQASAS